MPKKGDTSPRLDSAGQKVTLIPMFGLFRKPIAPAVKVVSRDIMRIRLEHWRLTPELVMQADRFLKNPLFRQMLDVVRNENPASDFMVSPTLEERAIAQARQEGYLLALNNLEAMGTPSTPNTSLEATFEEPDRDEP